MKLFTLNVSTPVSVRVRVPGMSLVELLVSVTLLAMVSIAAVQLLDMTESTLIGEQGNLSSQRKSEAVSAFIYKDFINGTLSDSTTPQIYSNSEMQDDLQDGSSISIATLFGSVARFNGVAPRCALTNDADLQAGTFTFKPDCLTNADGVPIVKLMNDLINTGVVLTTGLEDGVGRCSISKAIPYDLLEGSATVSVDDPNCLKWGADLTKGVPSSRQCDENQNHSICGFYREYDTGGEASSNSLAEQVTVDMSRLREFCLGD